MPTNERHLQFSSVTQTNLSMHRVNEPAHHKLPMLQIYLVMLQKADRIILRFSSQHGLHIQDEYSGLYLPLSPQSQFTYMRDTIFNVFQVMRQHSRPTRNFLP
ncbi:hypothetical protein Xszus_00827 [Xenorhabdus szentirmaii]|nr:hypothetical protein Xszus_00827 [Xenorhabdus szentirmaii]